MNNKIKIGIADDHALFRKSLVMLINMFAFYEVVLDAGNGKDLLTQIDNDNLPQIVLMDISMPVMDGYETTKLLSEKYPDIKVLALSTMESDTAIIKMIKCGCKGYILKDTEPAELKVAFEEVLNFGYYYNDLITRKVIRSINHLTDEKSNLNLFARLSQKEIEFLKHTTTELTYKEIADTMCLSVRTVEGYRDALCEKLGVKTRVGLAMYAVKNNLVDLKTPGLS